MGMNELTLVGENAAHPKYHTRTTTSHSNNPNSKARLTDSSLKKRLRLPEMVVGTELLGDCIGTLHTYAVRGILDFKDAKMRQMTRAWAGAKTANGPPAEASNATLWLNECVAADSKHLFRAAVAIPTRPSGRPLFWRWVAAPFAC